jgi:hypothetical protein
VWVLHEATVMTFHQSRPNERGATDVFSVLATLLLYPKCLWKQSTAALPCSNRFLTEF